MLVYLLQAEAGGPIKIGRTRADKLGERLRNLQSGSPLALRLLMVVHEFTKDSMGARKKCVDRSGENPPRPR